MAKKVVKVPQIMQMEALECGAACLAMILAYYGKWVPLEQVRADCGVSRDGSKAVNVLRAARSYGLTAKGMTMSTKALRNRSPFPCILFWNFNHFVVLAGFKGKNAIINDPGRGKVKVPLQQFEESFTGVALVFEKTDAFEPGGTKPSPLRFAGKRLQGLGSIIACVMLTSAVISFVGILDTSLSQVFLDRILSGDNADWIGPLTGIMLMLAAIIAVASILNAVYLLRVQGKVSAVSSSRFMRHLLHLPMRFYSQRMVGDLQQRQSANEQIAFMLIGQLAPVLVNGVMLVLYLAIMLQYSILLTVVGLTSVLFNTLMARHISEKRVNIARLTAASQGKLYSTTISGIEMIETIKASGAESGFFARWAGHQAAVNESEVRTAKVDTVLGAIPMIITQVANICVLVLGIWLIVNNSLTPGALLAFTGFLSAFMAPVNELITLSQTVQELTTQMERVEDVLEYPTDVPEESDPVAEASNLTREKLSGRVDLEDVTFGYSPLDAPIIEGFDLHMKPGQWVALVGESGCGKSTIAKLVSGLYKPWGGEIRFDNTPLADIPRPLLRGSLAVVDQDITIFEGTVSENVKLWDKSIEDYEVVMAARDAAIHETITSREGGYYSEMLPGGRNYSGGQLQRIEIARVLAQDPTIIILDEATSALDAQTEADVIRRIRERDITCIVVAHRLSTIRDCDEIIMLQEGKVVERGTHEELLANGSAYAELVRSD